MVIAVGGCDNVEWGGIDLAIVPPPSRAEDRDEAAPPSALPSGPVLFYVHRNGADATVIPVGQVSDDGLTPIVPGEDPEEFGARFMEAFLSPGEELILFRRGQRVGTLIIESAALPESPVCRPLPRATGRLQLVGADADELLALARASAPEGLSEAVQAERRMEVVSDMLARDMLRGRGLQVASPAAARRQLQPFPLAGTPDPGFAATYLVEDTLGVGGDDSGAALFVVYTPRGQTGYDTAFVGFTDYASGGKAAPRVVDYLDWDRDGNAELLLEVFGTHTSWFRAVGISDGQWRALFQDRCDPRTAGVDTADALPGEAPGAQAQPPAPTPSREPRTRPGGTPEAQAQTRDTRPGGAGRTGPPPTPDSALDSIPVIEPTVQLSNPGTRPRVRRDTVPPDSGSAS